MQELCADNLGTKEQHLHIIVLNLVKDQEESYWIMWAALGRRDLFSSVRMVGTTPTTVGMMMMQVWLVSEISIIIH